MIDYNDPSHNIINNIIKDNNIVLDISVNDNITINGVTLNTELIEYTNYSNIFEVKTNPVNSSFLDQTTEGDLETDISDIKIIPINPDQQRLILIPLRKIRQILILILFIT